MDLREYFKLPEGANVTMGSIPSFFDVAGPNFPCPPDMSYAMAKSKKTWQGYLDVSNTTNMSYMFSESSLVALDASKWNTSKVTNMSYMFNNCNQLTSLDLSGWDTSSVTDMSRMFMGCKGFTSNNLFAISSLNTSKVTTLESLFDGCNLTTFKSSELPWDTSSVTTLTNFVASNSNLKELDISTWDTSKLNNIKNLCNNCTNIEKIGFVNCVSVTDASYFFGYVWNDITSLIYLGGFKDLKVDWTDTYGLSKCPNLTYESVMNVINNLYDFRGNGDSSTTKKIKFHANSLALLSDADKAVATNKGWILQ